MMLSDESFQQVFHPVGHHPAFGLAFLGGGVATLQPCGVDLLRRDASLVQCNAPIAADRELAKPRAGAPRPVKNDEDLSPFWSHLDAKSWGSNVPVDSVLGRRRQRVDCALGQFDPGHRTNLL